MKINNKLKTKLCDFSEIEIGKFFLCKYNTLYIKTDTSCGGITIAGLNIKTGVLEFFNDNELVAPIGVEIKIDANQ